MDEYNNEQPNDTETTTPIPPANRMPVVRQLSILGLILLAIFCTSFVPRILAQLTPGDDEIASVAASGTEVTGVIDRAAFDSISLRADAAYVVDVNSGEVLYEKHADQQLPIASITKLMTALVAYEVVAMETSVTVPAHAIDQYGDSGLRAGESFALSTLTDLTLINSSNDGAFAIASAAGALLNDSEPAHSFVEAMNIRADELGLTNTYFRNPTGLDITEDEAGAYGSARDIAVLVDYILKHKPEILEATTNVSSVLYNEDGEYHEAENTNYMVSQIPGLIGSKTGYTTLAGGNLVIAFDASVNRPVIVVVLGSTYSGRFDDVLVLTKAAQQAVQ